MTAEWSRKAILDLIGEYRKQNNLYDMKHTLYYNKKARSKSLGIICGKVCETRPGTTPEEVHKKIQTLRTQIGQEIMKIEKSRELEDESLVHKPKVWWYDSFEWVAAYMKARNDPTTPLSLKLESSKSNLNKIELFTEEEEEANIQIEEQEIEEEPLPKRPRKSYPSAKTKSAPQEPQTIEYIITESENTTDNVMSNEQIVEPQFETVNVLQPTESIDRYKKRSKNFGRYVASLMQEIKNDKIFFETQTEILQIIEKATFKSYSNQ